MPIQWQCQKNKAHTCNERTGSQLFLNDTWAPIFVQSENFVHFEAIAAHTWNSNSPFTQVLLITEY